jgi:carbon monoxide dehydrogenase subunit G
MAISQSGEFTVARGREEVFAFLTDANRFAPLLPDLESVEVQDAKHSTVRVKVGVAHIRGTARVQLELAESEPPRRAVYRGKASVAGGTATLVASFALEASGNATRVTWQGEAQLYGPLISVAGGLLEPLAKKNIARMIDGLRQALS